MNLFKPTQLPCAIMAHQPILTFEEITSVSSIDALAGLYDRKGISVSHDKRSFIKVVKMDWKAETERLLMQAKEAPPPTSLPSLDVIIDQAKVSIHGIAHNKKTIAAIVNSTVGKGGNWLFEQLTPKEYPAAKSGVELPDFMFIPATEALSDGFQDVLMLLGMPLLVGLAFLASYITKSRILTNDAWYLNVPQDAWSLNGLPPYASIGFHEERSPPRYNSVERRSAYHAEFLRNWKRGEDRHIVVGALHAPQIRHFLLNGVKDGSVSEIAASHAELWKTDPEKLAKACIDATRRRTVYRMAGAYVITLPSTAFLELPRPSWDQGKQCR